MMQFPNNLRYNKRVFWFDPNIWDILFLSLPSIIVSMNVSLEGSR
jgi:hypothetical protein